MSQKEGYREDQSELRVGLRNRRSRVDVTRARREKYAPTEFQ